VKTDKEKERLEKQRYKVLATKFPMEEKARRLNISVGYAKILAYRYGLYVNTYDTKNKPQLSKTSDFTKKFLKRLQCPRCGKKTVNHQDSGIVYCANELKDGYKCMYHYSRKEKELCRKQIREEGIIG